jgi:hypothetical protein
LYLKYILFGFIINVNMIQNFCKTAIVFLISLGLRAQSFPQAEPIEAEEQKAVYFEKPKPVWKQKMHYGGNIWLGFWGSFYIDASPMVGYDISDKGTVVGVGASFIYQGAYKQAGALAAGGRLFVRQAVWRSVFAHAEYELMNATADNFYNTVLSSSYSQRKWGGSPLVGLGFYQGGGGEQKGSFISLMYNLGAPSFGYISPQGLGGNQSPILLRFGYFF